MLRSAIGKQDFTPLASHVPKRPPVLFYSSQQERKQTHELHHRSTVPEA